MARHVTEMDHFEQHVAYLRMDLFLCTRDWFFELGVMPSDSMDLTAKNWSSWRTWLAAVCGRVEMLQFSFQRMEEEFPNSHARE